MSENGPWPPPYHLVKCTDVPQFDALQNAAAEFHYDEKLHLRYLCNDTSRCSGLTAVLASFVPSASASSVSSTASTTTSGVNIPVPGSLRKVILDYSRQQVTGETMELLFDFADAVNFTERREAFRTGERINTTQDRPVLHHFLRMPPPFAQRPTVIQNVNRQQSVQQPRASFTSPSGGGGSSRNGLGGRNATQNELILEDIHAVRRQIDVFSRQVRSGNYRGVTGQTMVNTVVVSASSGGMHSGTQFVHQALAADVNASTAADGRRLHFLSNIDPVDTYFTTHDLDPARTLVVMVAKDFGNSNEMLNLRSIRNWLVTNLFSVGGGGDGGGGGGGNISENMIIERHMVAVTAVNSTYQHMGIPKSNIFRIWDWVIGRFSVCSAVGVLPLSLQYGSDIVSDFLNGAHDMDEHFFNAPLRDNIPVLMGLLGMWNSTFMGYTTRAVLPFSEALGAFPAHVQLIDMESNGKRVAVDGMQLHHPAGEIDFGEVAGNSHHPFYQLMHQGRVVPADFIGFMESPRPMELPGEAVSSHDEFMSNFFAQPDALAYGKSLVDLIQEGIPDGLREHMVFPGNRPSSSILVTRLDPFSIGQLLALYEHRTAVQGFLWGINSFDQFGLEMGKLLAKYIRVQLAASRRTGATVQGFNQSTSSLLEAYLAHGKQTK
jgi:glucose-6-phosphate isomerase